MARFLLLLLLCVSADVASAQNKRQLERPSEEKLHELRKRWEEKSPEERDLLRQRFDQLRSLSPEDHELLRERARRITDRKRHLQDAATEEDRRQFEQLPPWEREQRWRDQAVENSRERGRFLRESLPPEMRKRLEGASPEKRREILEELRRSDRPERSRDAIRHLGRRLRLTREEVRRLEALPDPDRMREILSLKRRVISESFQNDKFPEGLSDERWELLMSLDDEEFLHRIRPFLDRLFGKEGGPPWLRDRRSPPWDRGERDGPGGPGGMDRDGPRPGRDHERRGDGPPPPRQQRRDGVNG